MATTASTLDDGRAPRARPASGRAGDTALRWALIGISALILLLILGFFVTLVGQSSTAFSHFGLSFVLGDNWNVPTDVFHGLPLLVGTLVTSTIALLIGVPVAVAAAIYITELCPRALRTPLSILIDLLAAVPSVVYGLWGVFFLAPKLLGGEKWFASTFSFIPWVGGGADQAVPTNYFIAGLVLAIMIVPIVSAITREVLATVPSEHREAALALGATRWEMIRMAVLPYARSGITGGAMLGLGRALGETIAVVLLIGDNPNIGKHLFAQGYTYASVIANEFGEATGLHRGALFAAGLVLFVLTLFVNVLARSYVARADAKATGVTRRPGPIPGGAPAIGAAASDGI